VTAGQTSRALFPSLCTWADFRATGKAHRIQAGCEQTGRTGGNGNPPLCVGLCFCTVMSMKAAVTFALAEVRRKFDSMWVLLENPRTGPDLNVQRGTLL